MSEGSETQQCSVTNQEKVYLKQPTKSVSHVPMLLTQFSSQAGHQDLR
jgi:hypothetical protein